MDEMQRPLEGIALPEPGVATAARMRERKIIHIDMDAFYASVEQRDNPDLRGKPVAVGGSRARGVVMAASYEARKFDVRSAMPSVTAIRKCPELIFVPPRFEVYKAVSRQIHQILGEHTPVIEPHALDEAYLDVTDNLKRIASATAIAEEIRARVRAETQLTASAGVSYNKFLAKIASNHCKPDGLFVITPRMGPSFVATLSVAKFHGVGPVTCAKMERLGLRTGADIRAQTLAFLEHHFGKVGPFFYWIARGIDERPVSAIRARKSIGVETTFDTDLFSQEEIHAALKPIVEKLWSHCERTTTRGRTLTLKVKYADFQQVTRSRTGKTPFTAQAAVLEASSALASSLFPVGKGIRLLGVSLSALRGDTSGSQEQLRLWI
jgi:DNA polymerase-4